MGGNERLEKFKRDVTHDSSINFNSSRCFNDFVEPHVDTHRRLSKPMTPSRSVGLFLSLNMTLYRRSRLGTVFIVKDKTST